MKQKNVSCKEKVIVSEVDFANGISRKLIQGKINVNGTVYPFNLILDSLTVVDYTFDYIATDSSDYNCSVKEVASNIFEIQWIYKNKRVFLRKKAILEH